MVNNISCLYPVVVTWTGYELSKEKERALNGYSHQKSSYISFFPSFVRDFRERSRAKTGVHDVNKKVCLRGKGQKLAKWMPNAGSAAVKERHFFGVQSCDSVNASLLITLQRSYWRSRGPCRQLSMSLSTFLSFSSSQCCYSFKSCFTVSLKHFFSLSLSLIFCPVCFF